jgi:hypothetical protein
MNSSNTITTLLGDIIDPQFLRPIKLDWITESGYYLYWKKDTDQPRFFSKKWQIKELQPYKNVKYLNICLSKSTKNTIITQNSSIIKNLRYWKIHKV